MQRTILLGLLFALITSCQSESIHQKTSTSDKTYTLTEKEYYDKIKGGLVGQILGNLNGLPYEQTYNNEPGTLNNYVPSLPKGAFTDDDTDVEWTNIFYMEKEKEPFLAPEIISEAWLKHIYYYIYASNAYARELMSIGFSPTETGKLGINPWASYNVAGQFCSETYAFAAPGMCKSAEELAMHYTSISVDDEPLQSTQLFAAMISKAFFTDELNEILEAGIAAIDQTSQTYEAVQYAIKLYNEKPDDWFYSRTEIRRKYYFVENSNKSLRNTAAIISQFLLGKGDFVKTMEISFNWGFDADCNAATLASILGVVKGYLWFEEQGWDIADNYCNTGRPGLPEDETISKFTIRILNVGEIMITKNGGKIIDKDGEKQYIIKSQPAECIKKIIPFEQAFNENLSIYKPQIEAIFNNQNASKHELARATYLAFCTKTAEDFKYTIPNRWDEGIDALEENTELVYTIFKAPDNYISQIAKRTGLTFKAPEPQMDGKYEFKLDGYLDAGKVYLGGTFDGNNWESWKMPMKRTKTGWITKIDTKPGKYHYKYIVDGKAIFDPQNPEKETNCEDRTNSVIVLQ